MNIQNWFPLGLTGLISLLSKRLKTSPAPQFESIHSLVLRPLYGPTLFMIHYWSGLLFPSQRDFPDPGIEFASPAGRFFTTKLPQVISNMKGTIEDEMVGWHHRFNGQELGQTQGDGKGQGSLASWSPQGHRESDMTEQLNNNDTPGTVFAAKGYKESLRVVHQGLRQAFSWRVHCTYWRITSPSSKFSLSRPNSPFSPTLPKVLGFSLLFKYVNILLHGKLV